MLTFDWNLKQKKERTWYFSHDFENCGTLPKYDPAKTYLHMSYKTSNQSQWNSAYRYIHQQWFNLHPDWEPIFWTDEQNELLFKCHPNEIFYENFMKMLRKIKRVDFSKIMYLYQYGGMYSDFGTINVFMSTRN